MIIAMLTIVALGVKDSNTEMACISVLKRYMKANGNREKERVTAIMKIS